MNVAKFRSLHCDVNINVPGTVQEYDELAKKDGACLQEAIANVVYRSTLAQFRDKFTTKVEEITGIERETEETDKKDKDGNPVMVFTETEGTYINRVIAEKGWSEDKSELQAIADQIAAELTFDPSATERKPAGPKKAPKKFVAIIEEKWQAGKQDALAAKFNVTLTGDKDKDVQALAKRLKEEVDKQAEELLKQQVA